MKMWSELVFAKSTEIVFSHGSIALSWGDNLLSYYLDNR